MFRNNKTVIILFHLFFFFYKSDKIILLKVDIEFKILALDATFFETDIVENQSQSTDV